MELDHATVRWVIKSLRYSRRRFIGGSLARVWVAGGWTRPFCSRSKSGVAALLYRAVDKTGRDDQISPRRRKRDEQAAKRFLTKAIRRHGVPEKITIDGSAANEAAIKSYNEEHGTAIEIRKIKYLNNIVEQDHRGVKRVTRPMLGFTAFDGAVHPHRYRTDAYAAQRAV